MGIRVPRAHSTLEARIYTYTAQEKAKGGGRRRESIRRRVREKFSGSPRANIKSRLRALFVAERDADLLFSPLRRKLDSEQSPSTSLLRAVFMIVAFQTKIVWGKSIRTHFSRSLGSSVLFRGGLWDDFSSLPNMYVKGLSV